MILSPIAERRIIYRPEYRYKFIIIFYGWNSVHWVLWLINNTYTSIRPNILFVTINSHINNTAMGMCGVYFKTWNSSSFNLGEYIVLLELSRRWMFFGRRPIRTITVSQVYSPFGCLNFKHNIMLRLGLFQNVPVANISSTCVDFCKAYRFITTLTPAYHHAATIQISSIKGNSSIKIAFRGVSKVARSRELVQTKQLKTNL